MTKNKEVENVKTDDLLVYYSQMLQDCKDLETLKAVTKQYHNVLHTRMETEQLPLRYQSGEDKRMETLRTTYAELNMLAEQLEPALIDKWCEDYTQAVVDEREIREEIIREVIDALPFLYGRLKQVYDMQESLRKDKGQAEVLAHRGYQVQKFDKFALPWGIVPDHATSEREVIASMLMACVGSALKRGQLNEKEVNTDAVMKHQPLFCRTSNQKQVVGEAQ